MSVTTKTVRSYHTFLFPFLYNVNGNITRRHFFERLRKGWEPDVFDPQSDAKKSSYDPYHYFNQAARKAIYTQKFDNNAVVWNYRFDLEQYVNQTNQKSAWLTNPKDENNPAVLTLYKVLREYPGNQTGVYSRDLCVNGIRLKLYNNDIGLLMIELENYDETATEEDIILINEFGRRVFMPYVEDYPEIDDGNFYCKLCADTVTLSFNGNAIKEASGNISQTALEHSAQTNLAPLLTFLLSDDNHTVSTAGYTPNKSVTYITPIVDDRMFTACIFIDNEFPKAVAKWDAKKSCYAYQSAAYTDLKRKNNLASRLYKMMFVDGDGLSCYNRNMLSSLLAKHIYGRWLEYGTITGITDYSMITVSSFAPATVPPFLTEYVEMMALCLAQRASLLAFERVISDIICNNNSVKNLQQQYLTFQSDLLLQEITAQQQGIELYGLLRKNLFIDDQHDQIRERIRALYEDETAKHEKKENIILLILALLGICESVEIVLSVFWPDQTHWLNILVSAVLITGVLLLYHWLPDHFSARKK